MLSPTLEKALNEQINHEFYSAHLYLSMSAYFRSIDLEGFAHWMKMQFEEETFHGMKILEFIDAREGRIKLQSIAAPPIEWEAPLAVFEQTCEHERKVTGLINQLAALAETENDRAASNFLQWFIAEQIEEEATAKSIKAKLKFAGGSPTGLLMLDQEMAKRTFAASAE